VKRPTINGILALFTLLFLSPLAFPQPIPAACAQQSGSQIANTTCAIGSTIFTFGNISESDLFSGLPMPVNVVFTPDVQGSGFSLSGFSVVDKDCSGTLITLDFTISEIVGFEIREIDVSLLNPIVATSIFGDVFVQFGLPPISSAKDELVEQNGSFQRISRSLVLPQPAVSFPLRRLVMLASTCSFVSSDLVAFAAAHFNVLAVQGETIQLTISENQTLPSRKFDTSPRFITSTAKLTDGSGNLVSDVVVDFVDEAANWHISGHDHTNGSALNHLQTGFFQDAGGVPTTSCKTVNGTCSLLLRVPEVSGQYSVRAVVDNDPSVSSGIVDLVVQVPDLQLLSLPDTSLSGETAFRLTGKTANHSANHYGTEDLRLSVKAIADDYFIATNSTLGINDMSLGWGGLFDIAGEWFEPHSLHRDGMSVDIDHLTQGQFASTNELLLDQLATLAGFRRIPESGASIHYELDPAVLSF
jgi:hypothetical protein